MVRTLRLQNFKAHRSTTIELERLTLLVGANGVGKTSVLEALDHLSQLWAYSPRDVFVGAHSPRTFVRDPALPTVFHSSHVQADGGQAEVYLKIELGAGDLWTASGELGPGGPKISERESFIGKGDGQPMHREVWTAQLFRLDARAVAEPGYFVSRMPRVEADGANTAAVIASWKLDDDERLKKTIDDLQRVVPHVRSVRVRQHVDPSKGGANGYSLFFDFDDAKDVPASSVSEGTLIALAILTALNARSQPAVFLLDDLGSQLHPTAQGDLVRLLEDVLRQNPSLQIVASTHSPYVLDATSPANVRVFARGADGAAHVRRLDQHPDAGRAEALTTGQLWTLDPESWVLQDAP